MSILDTATKVAVLTASVCFLLGGAVSTIRSFNMTPSGSYAALESTAWTNAEAADIVFTNKTSQPKYACVKARVRNKAGNATESDTVCSGQVPGHTTVQVKAHYKVGAVLDLCNKQGAFNAKVVDWDVCVFDVIDQTSAVQASAAK